MSMNCPSCKKGKLKPSFIDDLFRCNTCNDCGGNWFYLTDYLHWLGKGKSVLTSATSLVERDDHDTKNAMLCPITGQIMLKYRISNKSSHRLDLSPSISAIWLDKGEWELIKEEGLSRQLNQIFTEPWQRKVKSDQAKETLEVMYLEEFGESDYTKLKEIRIWLENNDNKQAMLAYLLAGNPYTTQ